MRRLNIYHKLLIAGFVSVLGGLFLNTSVAYAYSESFGRSLSVAIQGPNANISATETRLKIKGQNTNRATVIVDGACDDQTGGVAGMSVTYDGVTKSSNSDCENYRGDNGQNYRGLIFKNTAVNRTLVARKINGQGHQPFKVYAESPLPLSTITPLENPRKFESDFNGTDDNSSFTVWAGSPYEVTFDPACSDLQARRVVYFKWNDADDGNGDNRNKNAKIQIVRKKKNSNKPYKLDPVDNVGGQGKNGRIGIRLEPEYDSYEVRWTGIDGGNAIKMVSPYERDPDGSCEFNTEPEGDINKVVCLQGSEYIRLRGYDRDPTDNTKIRVSRINSSGNGTSSVISERTHTGDPTAYKNYSVPGLAGIYDAYSNGRITFILEVQDTQTNAWHEKDRETYGRSPNPCQPPPTPPHFTLHVTCSGVTIQNIDDPQDGGYGLQVFARFFHRNVDGNGVESFADVGDANWDWHVDDINDGYTIPWPWGNEDGANNGWAMHIGAYDVVNGNGGDANPRWYYSAEVEGGCLQASCSLDVIENLPGSPDKGVKAGENFNVNATIHNPAAAIPVFVYNHPEKPRGGTGTWSLAGQAVTENLGIPDSLGGNQLTMTDGGGNYDYPPFDFSYDPYLNIPRGGSATSTMTFTAPGTRGVTTVAGYPDFWGRMALGGICQTEVEAYQRYDFTAAARGSLDNAESPTQAEFRTSITQRGVDVDSNARRDFYKRPKGGAEQPIPFGPFNDTTNFGNRDYTDTYNIPANTSQLGDIYCVYITLDYGHGWRGPGNGKYANEGPAQANSCGRPCEAGAICNPTPSVVNRPYIRTYGGDVAAGGGFGTSCGRTDSKILSFMRPMQYHISGAPDGQSGSGGQLAAFALGEIRGYTTASTRTGPPNVQEPKGLTFAHNNSAPAQSNDPLLGGNMSGDGWCMPDYFSSTQFVENDRKNVSSSTASIDPFNLENEKQTVRNISGNKLRIVGSNVAQYDRRHTVYVDGDVFILNNLMYRTSYGAGTASIPNFTLVVKGNIYIDNDVTQLDGTYIAQPDARSNSGRIYTCALESSGDNPVTAPTSLFTECGAQDNPASSPRRQLTVNGSFIAQRVVLNRTGYSLRDSLFREEANNTKAAETFKFSPEVYLSPPVFRANSTQTSGDYQYISILAPVL